MRIEDKHTIQKEIITVTQVTCDTCGKVLFDINTDYGRFKKPEERFYRVKTCHQDWGADSCESIEYADYCQECIAQAVQGYLLDPSYTKEMEIMCKEPCRIY